MKKNILPILILSMSILHSGCTKVLLYSYGVRNPKIENQKTILNYLNKNSLKTENIFALKDTLALKTFFDSKIGTPEIRFYDKNGYLMKYRDDKKCNGQNDSLISFLDPQNIISVDSLSNIKSYLTELNSLEGNALSENEFKDYDYYLVIYWAKYLGKVNSVKIMDWEKSLSRKNDIKIKTIKVTTDYMDFWHVPQNQMFKIYSKQTKAKAEDKY